MAFTGGCGGLKSLPLATRGRFTGEPVPLRTHVWVGFIRAFFGLGFMDDPKRFVFGKGSFVDDFRLPEMLYIKFVRSPHARARVTRVKGGINSSELKASLASVGEGAVGSLSAAAMPVLASGYVNFVGQPVAAVLGNSRYEAEDLLESVEVDYEPLKPVVDIEEALKTEPIHQGLKSNVFAAHTLGSKFEVDFDLVLEDTFRIERVAANPIEPRGVIAYYDGSRLNVWVSTQSVFSVKRGLASSLGIPESVVRVIQADTGGGFGSKGGLYPEYVVAAYASMKTRRPVKWIESRTENIQASNHGRGALAHMKLYAKNSGRVTGLEAQVYVDAGAYAVGLNIFAPRFIGFQLTGPYSIRNAYVEAYSVCTNKVPLGPYRGAGRPEAAFFVERMMDMLADKLGISTVDVRLINTQRGSFTSPLGLRVESAREFLEEALAALDARQRLSQKGWGLSFFVLVPTAQPGEGARISVKGGRVKVWLGGNGHGQGHEFFVKRLVAEELGVSEDVVDLERGDTDMLTQGVGTWGSRSAMVAGAAVVEAARKLRSEAREKLGSTGASGGYSPQELLKGEFSVEVFYRVDEQINTLGVNLVRAEVDELGSVRVGDCLAYYDVGRALTPWMVEAQVHGGCAQGVGQVLYESVRYSSDGQLLTTSILDAGLPYTTEVPSYTVLLTEHPSTLPHGAKGVGESPTIGVPPALVRAIETLTGKRINHTPILPAELADKSH
ncbi:MAG: xanthine dehydrogenase family protein molybdopterin-binding subunit [Thermoprotei archaeon]